MKRTFRPSFSRVRSDAPPPPPKRPQGMLTTASLLYWTMHAEKPGSMFSAEAVKELLGHIAAADRLLGLLHPAVLHAENARIAVFRARSDVIRAERLSPSEAIKRLHAIIKEPDGETARLAHCRLRARELRDAALALIMEGLPNNDAMRAWLNQRADRLDKGETV